MTADWFYARDGKPSGPVGFDELKWLAASGQLLATDLAWTEGMAGWSPAGQVEGLITARDDRWYYVREGRRNGPVDWAGLRELAEAGHLRPEDFVWGTGRAGWENAAKVEGLSIAQPPRLGDPRPPIQPIPVATSPRNGPMPVPLNSSTVWYHTRGAVQSGPVSFSDLSGLARGGNLAPMDLLWREGMENWERASLHLQDPGDFGVSGLGERLPTSIVGNLFRPRNAILMVLATAFLLALSGKPEAVGYTVVLFSATLVYLDASRNLIGRVDPRRPFSANMSAGMWAFMTLVLWIVILPLYLMKRPGLIELARTQPRPARFSGPIAAVLGSLALLSLFASFGVERRRGEVARGEKATGQQMVTGQPVVGAAEPIIPVSQQAVTGQPMVGAAEPVIPEILQDSPSGTGRALKVVVETPGIEKMAWWVARYNESLTNVSASASDGQLILRFDVDGQRTKDIPATWDCYPLIVTLFDEHGQYLSHFETVENFTAHSTVADQRRVVHDRFVNGGALDEAEKYKTILLQPTGNILSYPVNLRDLRDTSIVRIGFTHHP